MSRTSTLVDLNKGGIAKLADQSIFRIASGHLPRVAEWTPGTEVTIDRSNNSMWQYVLSAGSVKVNATPSSGRDITN